MLADSRARRRSSRDSLARVQYAFSIQHGPYIIPSDASTFPLSWQRTTGLLVGKLSVGISGFPAGSSGSSLGEALGAVLPAVQYLPLSTKGLNKCLYAPKKDYETEQVPPYSTQNV